MPTDRDVLLAAALDDPSDDTARLVLADYLREHGPPADQLLGRFLWAGVTLAGPDTASHADARRELAAVAVSGAPAAWVSDLGLGPRPLTLGDWTWKAAGDRVTVEVGAVVAQFDRGMLSALTLTLDEWPEAAPLALSRWPVGRVIVSDVPGFAFWVERPSAWRLSATLWVPARPGLPASRGGGPEADWQAEEEFPDRVRLVAGASAASARLAQHLWSLAGGRWPPRPRR